MLQHSSLENRSAQEKKNIWRIFEWGHNLRFYIYALIGTTAEIPWLFSDFDSKLQNSLTCNKIPWLFPDSEKDWNFPDHGKPLGRYWSRWNVVHDTASHASDHLCQIGKSPSKTVHAAEGTQQDVPYFISFIAKSWLNDLEDIGQRQRSLYTTHSLMIRIICVKYGKNPSRTVRAEERTRQDVPYLSSFISKSWLNDFEDIG